MKKLIKKLKKVNWKDILTRAGKTFVQGFLASISVDELSTLDISVIKCVLISALAGGISAIWNFIIELINTELEED